MSFPQCGKTLPSTFAFTILGVNNGRAFDDNPCLASLMSWALGGTPSATRAATLLVLLEYRQSWARRPRTQRWPAAGLEPPRPCDGSAQPQLRVRLRLVRGAGGHDPSWWARATSSPWWLDVETANTWSADVASNAAVLEGAVALLQKTSRVPSVGVYSSPRQWAQITGAGDTGFAYQPAVRQPAQLAGASALGRRGAHAVLAHFHGGRVKLVQYLSGGFDAACACF